MPERRADHHTASHASPGPFTCIAAAAARQHGLITTSQLHSCGLSGPAITRWTQLGRLERLSRGVYRLASTPSTWHQRALAAVLDGPDRTALSHRAGAALLGMRGFHRDTIEVTSTRWHRSRLTGVRIHESLVLPDEDLTVVDGITTTNRIRTLIDLGAVAHSFKIGRALDEERRRGNVELRTVKTRLEELAVQGRNGICRVRDLVDMRLGIPLASTSFEQLFISIVLAFGLPMPEMQVRVVDGEFVAFLDFAYRVAKVAIEADSEEYHLDLARFHHDRERQNRLVLLGWRFLRFTKEHLRHQPRLVAEQVASALGLPFTPHELPLSGR